MFEVESVDQLVVNPIVEVKQKSLYSRQDIMKVVNDNFV